jgi:hypothetical protein
MRRTRGERFVRTEGESAVFKTKVIDGSPVELYLDEAITGDWNLNGKWLLGYAE